MSKTKGNSKMCNGNDFLVFVKYVKTFFDVKVLRCAFK